MSKRVFVCFFLGLFVCQLFSQPILDTAVLRSHVVFLSSDSLQGRRAGTLAAERSAQYVSQQFQKEGLQLWDGEAYQTFPFEYGRRLAKSSYFKSKNYEAVVGIDFIPPFSVYRLKEQKARIVFVGYGLETSSFSDYENVNVSGKWVLMVVGKPDGEPYKQAEGNLAHKIVIAETKGAKGVLIVTPQTRSDSLSPDLLKSIQSKLPFVLISKKLCDTLLSGNSLQLDSFIQASQNHRSNLSRLLKRKFSYQFAQEVAQYKGRNVLAYLEGNDSILKKEWIVIGAHYDHLGLRIGRGDSIRRISHGADDNASGVSGMLELAKFFVKKENRTARSMVFVAFDAEELGLIGSSYFVDHPPKAIDTSDIVSMVNLDMIGRYRSEVGLIIIGLTTITSSDSLFKWLQMNTSLKLIRDESLLNASDQYPFYRKGIPVFFFSTGLHPDYHKSTDTSDKLDIKKMEEVLQLSAKLITKIGNGSKKPLLKTSQ